jgi:hypothetical protein
MIGDISIKTNLYVICGYTNYPRSIIIQEIYCNDCVLQRILTFLSNNILFLF